MGSFSLKKFSLDEGTESSNAALLAERQDSVRRSQSLAQIDRQHLVKYFLPAGFKF